MFEGKEERWRDFAMLVHQVIIVEKRHSVKVITQAMGLSEHAFTRQPLTACRSRRTRSAAS